MLDDRVVDALFVVSPVDISSIRIAIPISPAVTIPECHVQKYADRYLTSPNCTALSLKPFDLSLSVSSDVSSRLF